VISTTTVDVSTVTPKVTWPNLPRDDRALASLGADKSHAMELLLQASVPVLAPTNVTFEKPTFIVKKEFWSLTGRVNGATIAIQGTRVAHRYDDIAPAAGNRSLRGSKGFVSINEGIRTASWIENGVAYSLDVECANPAADARCTDEAFTVDLVDHLGFAGGGGAR
jgi:hypothetical protein